MKTIIMKIKIFFMRVCASTRRIFWKFIDLFCRTYVGIDISASEIRILTAKRNIIRKWSSLPLSEGLIKDGIILEPQTLGLVLDNIFTSMKLPRNRVICNMTGMPFVYRVINMPFTGDNIDKEAIERAARKEMSLSEIDMYLFWEATETHHQLKERDFLVFGVPRHVVHLLVEALSKARIKRYMLDVKPLALARSVSSKDAILVNLEKEYVDIVVVVGGIIRVMHGFAPTRNENASDSFNREVLNGIRSAVKSLNRDYDNIPLPAEVPTLIFGGFTNDTDIANFLKENYENPVSNIELPDITPTNLPKPQFTAALGLLWKTLPEKEKTKWLSEYKDIDINFFSRLNKPLTERFKPSYAVTALSLIALIALVYFSHDYYRKVSAEVDSLDTESITATLFLNKARNDNKDALEIKKQEIDSLQNLQAQLEMLENERQYISGLQREYNDEINFIVTALPPRCQYTQITLNSNGYSVTGEADSLYDVLSYTNNLENDSEFLALIKSVQPLATDSVKFEVNINRH
ncbi:MAG: pilus assembly protein PilM [Dehalococcoidia bacterium]|jgi:Tfp pilus assembly protein PilN